MGWRTTQTVLCGVALGGALLATLTVAGALGPGHQRPANLAGPAPTPTHQGPLTTTQPELHKALLTALDLPGYAPGAVRATSGASRHGRVAAASCRALVERPWDRTEAAGGERAETGYADPDGGLLRQMVTVLDGDGADRAVTGVRRDAGRCQEFGATLEDSNAVRVRFSEVDLRRVGDASYAVRFAATGRTAEGASRTWYGYLAVGRLGPVLSVLHRVGPRPVTDENIADTLGLAVGRLRDVADLVGKRGN